MFPLLPVVEKKKKKKKVKVRMRIQRELAPPGNSLTVAILYIQMKPLKLCIENLFFSPFKSKYTIRYYTIACNVSQ